MLYYSKKETNELGTFKNLVVKVKNDEQSRLIAKLVRTTPADVEGYIHADPDVNFVAVIKNQNSNDGDAVAISLNAAKDFSWDIVDSDVAEALKGKKMLGAFIIEVLEITDDFIFFEISVMLDKDLSLLT